MNIADWLPSLAIIPPTIIATLAAAAFYHNRVKDREEKARKQSEDKKNREIELLSVMEQNFNVLQRINETALSSKENLEAAIRSVNPNDEIEEKEARKIFFHFMRINRLMRVYEYTKVGFISKGESDRIVDAHIGTLKEAMPMLDKLNQRGYPSDFIEYLNMKVSKCDRASSLSRIID